MADLALMSWGLWLLGHADTALARIDAAIQRADAISHPHSQAYACYYASILHALRGEFLTAQGYAEQWWPEPYRSAKSQLERAATRAAAGGAV